MRASQSRTRSKMKKMITNDANDADDDYDDDAAADDDDDNDDDADAGDNRDVGSSDHDYDFYHG